jgi:pimeloyl-ACP methyl ester carboxylesterase
LLGEEGGQMLAPTTTCEIPAGEGCSIPADVYGTVASPGAVVLCHGFKGHRRWGFIPWVAGELAAAGFCAVAIDFSHNGTARPAVVPGAETYTDRARFQKNTLDRERRDLATAVEWIGGGCCGCERPQGSIGLWGHSRGGVAAILVALDDPAIGALCTWSTVAHPDFYTARQKERWRSDGFFGFRDTATGTKLAMGIGYLEDLEQNHDRYDLAARAGGLEVPHLVVHGELDLAAPVRDAVAFFETPLAMAPKALLRLKTGHRFGCKNGGSGPELDEAVHATVNWFERHLTHVGPPGGER